MPVSYIQPVPGWKASGKVATRSTNSSAETSRCSGLPNTPRSIIAACRGVCSMTMPHPEVPASRSRTVIGRSAGTVRSSGASGDTSTRGSAASGSQRAMGSSSASTPSRTRVRVSAPPIGLVIDAMRNCVSSRMGGLPGLDAGASARAQVFLPADAHRRDVPGHAAGLDLAVEHLPHALHSDDGAVDS